MKISRSVVYTYGAVDGFEGPASVAAGATLSAPTRPGTFAYHCTFHTNMHGTLVVK